MTTPIVLGSRYELKEELGAGAFGTVHKARDHVLEEDVAIKLLRPDIASDPDLAHRFRQENRLARRVRHKNVCGIHEYGENGDLKYIAMELIDGVDLRHLLKERGPLPTAEAFDTALQAGEGLQAIHDAGIIHRDLKTSNIMRDVRGQVRLMDFGIAKQHGAEATLAGTAVGVIMGTPEYMSPEQARGERIDFRSDIYALGIVVFEIFTGSVPFRGETPLATIVKQLLAPPPLSGPQAALLPAPLVPVLEKALAKSPEERHGSVHELLDALRAARDASATSSAASTPPASTVVGSTPIVATAPTGLRRERERVRALKRACDRLDEALARGNQEQAADILAEARASLGDIDPLPSYGRRLG